MAGSSYVIYGTAPWDAPWLTEHNLAHALSKRHRVVYVEPPLTPVSPLRYGIRPHSRAQARRVLRRRPRDDGALTLFQPLVLPPRSNRTAQALSAPLLRWQIAQVVSELGIEKPVAVAAHATPGIVGAAQERFLVYLVKDWIEDGADLLGRSGIRLAGERDRMCVVADLVCAISPQLQRTLQEKGVPAKLLKHGFHGELVAAYERNGAPPEYHHLPGPILGYAGRIDARLDFELLTQVARRFVGGSLVLIGPISPRLAETDIARLRSCPNVHFLGTKSREVLPAYLSHLNCSLMPYCDREWLRHGSPLKLWDYLYAGPPIVGSGCLALRDYLPPLVTFVGDTRGFVAAVERALANGRAGRTERRAFALANTWDARALELEEMVQKAMGP